MKYCISSASSLFVNNVHVYWYPERLFRQSIRSKFLNNGVFMSLIILSNSADPDEMPPFVAFHLGLHYWPKQVNVTFNNQSVMLLFCHIFLDILLVCSVLKSGVYVIVIPWLVRLNMGIIHELSEWIILRTGAKHGITILYILYQCRPCTSQVSSFYSW